MALTLRENICSASRLPRDTDVLIARADLLASEDRELVAAVMVRGQTAVSVSRMMGVSPRKVTNRIKRLAARLTSRRFLDAARALPYLPPEDAKLASLRFCAGLSERKLAEKLGSSPHYVRRHLDRITAQIAMIRRIRRGQDKGRAAWQTLSALEAPHETYPRRSASGRREK